MISEQENSSFDNYINSDRRFKRKMEVYKGGLKSQFSNINKGLQRLINNQFLNAYLNALNIRISAIAHENVFYIIKSKNLKAAVIPFKALRCSRGGGDERDFTWGRDGVTMRQYVAFHLGRSNIYGLTMTEAENKPQETQGDHNHGGFAEETIFLSDKVEIVSGDGVNFTSGDLIKFNLSQATIEIETDTTDITIDSSLVLTGKISGKIHCNSGSIIDNVKITADILSKLAEGKTIQIGGVSIDPNDILHIEATSGRIFIPDITIRQIYDFGDMSFAPVIGGEGIQHRLSNPNPYPSVDFTLKNPWGQLTRGKIGPKGSMRKFSPKVRKLTWGEIYTQVYHKYNGEIPTSVMVDNRGMLMFDSDGNIIEENSMSIQANIGVIEPNKTTHKMKFTPLDGKTQIIRIFPWPKNIPEVDQWMNEKSLKKIKAVVTVYDSKGNSATVEIKGGDVIILNKEGSNLEGFDGKLAGEIVGYKIQNKSDNLQLMFVTMTKAGDE